MTHRIYLYMRNEKGKKYEHWNIQYCRRFFFLISLCKFTFVVGFWPKPYFKIIQHFFAIDKVAAANYLLRLILLYFLIKKKKKIIMIDNFLITRVSISHIHCTCELWVKCLSSKFLLIKYQICALRSSRTVSHSLCTRSKR